MRLFSYVVRYDIGFAPNPFYGWCTLATCKQDIRAHAGVGDWIVGTGSASTGLGDRLVYAMTVEETTTFDEYWADSRFAHKRPNLHGSLKQQYGDNIYHRDVDGRWIQEDSRHSHDDGTPNEGHIVRDTKADVVLLSRKFVYFGGDGPAIPAHLRGEEDLVHGRPAYRVNFSASFVAAAIGWIESLGTGVLGTPRDWPKLL
ncbi:hypothetical protein [Nocardioides caricicola]|uniref:Nucleotide modification associated domain-containing protein n=1 Tax=Nocardioides caricicola TaxID=634770 RepID=A0ABW0N0J1_9ACTN